MLSLLLTLAMLALRVREQPSPNNPKENTMSKSQRNALGRRTFDHGKARQQRRRGWSLSRIAAAQNVTPTAVWRITKDIKAA